MKGEVLMMNKTPEYTKNAIDNYRRKFDIVQIRLPKGTKKRIETQGYTINAYINKIVLEDLERRENGEKINAELGKISKTGMEKPEFDALNEFIKQKQAENEKKRAENPVLGE